MIQKVQSDNALPLIQVTKQQNDMNNQKVDIEYIFRFDVKDVEIEREGETVTVHECYEVVEKASFPLESKAVVPFLLEMMFDEDEDSFLAMIALSEEEIPSIIREAV
jgi:hypothetical protein